MTSPAFSVGSGSASSVVGPPLCKIWASQSGWWEIPNLYGEKMQVGMIRNSQPIWKNNLWSAGMIKFMTDYSRSMEKKHDPNHQPDNKPPIWCGWTVWWILIYLMFSTCAPCSRLAQQCSCYRKQDLSGSMSCSSLHEHTVGPSGTSWIGKSVENQAD